MLTEVKKEDLYTDNAVTQAEKQIKKYEEARTDAECLERLLKNPDFQRVIFKRYIRDHALLMADNMTVFVGNEDSMKSAQLSIFATAELKDFFRTMLREGAMARNQIEQAKTVLAEALAEISSDNNGE